MSCGSEDDAAEMEEIGEEMEEEVGEISLEGDYRGTWSSTTDQGLTFSGVTISAIFEFTDNTETRLRGWFFLSDSPGTINENLGTMTLSLDGNTITSFRFFDTIPDCNGDFTGTGSVISRNPFTLEIDFTGEDCDGNHIGQMVFTRVTN
ncbi:MAG: hypothetical protein AAF039_15525 [Bacteroidota bacterium]